MEENLANRSRAELEAALLDSGRALQATLASQLRGFDGEWAWDSGHCRSGERGTHGASPAEEGLQGVGLALWGWGLRFGGSQQQKAAHGQAPEQRTHEPPSLRPLRQTPRGEHGTRMPVWGCRIVISISGSEGAVGTVGGRPQEVTLEGEGTRQCCGVASQA